MIPVLVTTEYKGVFVGLVPDNQDMDARSFPLMQARMAIRWGTSKGVMQLAESGPTSSSLISAKADIPALHGITAVFSITPEAWEKWQSA